MEYRQSQTVQEIKTKHPFPWREQRMMDMVRMVDALGNEVTLFEITALAAIITQQLARPSAPQEEKKEQV